MTIKAAPKPSAQFIQQYNRLKKDGLTERELTSLMVRAQKEIATSPKPHEAAKMFTAQVKGWVKKGEAEPYGTAEMAGWVFKGAADAKAIAVGVKALKANAAALQAKSPALKTVDFKSLARADFGDTAFLAVKDTHGRDLGASDPRAKALKAALGSGFASVNVGAPAGD